MKNDQLKFLGNKNMTPQTYGIKYAGSKLKIIPYIISLLNQLKDVKTVLDGFSGTTRVSQALAQLGYCTTASDISIWSDVVANCFNLGISNERFTPPIKKLSKGNMKINATPIKKTGICLPCVS